MRPDVGGPGDGAAAAEVTTDEQRVTAFRRRQLGQHLDIGAAAHHHLVRAEEERPVAADTAQDRVVGLAQDLGHEALRHLDPVVIGMAGHGQRLLHRRVAPAGAAVDALEAEIAADHHQPAAGAGPVADELEPVRHRLALHPDRRRQQEGVGPDIRQDDGLVFGKARGGEGETLGRLMRGHIDQLERAVLEGVDQRGRAEVEGHAAELIEALVVGGGGDPAFAGEKDFTFRHQPELRMLRVTAWRSVWAASPGPA